MVQVVSLLDEWPIPASDELTAAGIAALRAAAGEDEKDVRRDHDLLYGITANAKVPPFESVPSLGRKVSFSTRRRWRFATSTAVSACKPPSSTANPMTISD